MTLVSSIISDAFRECNMLAIGKDPTADQSTEALRLYNALLSSVYGGAAGELLTNWPLGDFGRNSLDDTCLPPLDHIQRPQLDNRLIATNDAAMTVYLSPWPQDGARMGLADPFGRLSTVPVTLDANGRTIEDTPTLLLDTDGLFREWIYRSDLAAWLRVTDLTADLENPFPPMFDNMFIILLAMRLNPRYGRTIDDQSTLILKDNRRQFIARYLQALPLQAGSDLSWPFLSRQSYGLGRSFSSTQAFNRGSYIGN